VCTELVEADEETEDEVEEAVAVEITDVDDENVDGDARVDVEV